MVNHNFVNQNRTWETRDKISPEQKLWLAVIGAAAEDAISDAEYDIKGYPRMNKSSDIAYFMEPTRNFYQVCYWAGLDPEYVLRKMRRAIHAKKA